MTTYRKSRIWKDIFQCHEKDCKKRSIKGHYCAYHYAEKVVVKAEEEGWLRALLEKVLGGLEVELVYNNAQIKEKKK